MASCPNNYQLTGGCSSCCGSSIMDIVAAIEIEVEGEPMLVRTGPHPGSARFHEILGELGALHDVKGADYGTEKDPFANVRGSEEWGVEPWVGALIRATDKVRRLQKYARVGKLANEAVEDSFRDLAVYAVIALVLFEEVRDAKTTTQ